MKVDNAIILAAGMGERCVPLTYEKHKGMIEVFGETMVERQINQCIEKGISNIYIVTGYMSKSYDKLKLKYPYIKLIKNDLYSKSNNIYSMYLVRDILKNSYILSCDNYYSCNIFSTYETKSWYCLLKSDEDINEWQVRLDEDDKITSIEKFCSRDEYYLYGAVFLDENTSLKLKKYLIDYIENKSKYECLWEQILLDNIQDFDIYANKKTKDLIYEIDSFKDLQEIDISYIKDTKTYIIEKLYDIFKVDKGEIYDFSVQKGGMTNDSFSFCVKNEKYICRITPARSKNLVDRYTEKMVYDNIKNIGISDEIIYFSAKEGIKISKFIKNARTLDAYNKDEVKKAMEFLKDFHKNNIVIDKVFDLKEQINNYENLCNIENKILDDDYIIIKQKIFEKLDYLKSLNRNMKLCHIDYICENILVLEDDTLRLIDWEYACMCDPLIDIAMFAIFSYYDDDMLNEIINYYLGSNANITEKNVIDIYVSASGLLWYLWSKYKQENENDIKEYMYNMYNYAKKII